MPRSIRIGTLTLTLPAGWTIGLALVLLVGGIGTAEGIARIPALHPYLPAPMVSGHRQIAVKLDLLDRLESQGITVDCYLVGSSMILRGVEPETLMRAYTEAAGEPITCFNFGLQGLSIKGAADLTKILVEQHHPKLILYGTNFRDFAGEIGFGMDIPWSQYQLGQGSLEGALESGLASYRYLIAYSQKPERDGPDLGMSAYGFLPSGHVGDVEETPEGMKRYYEAFADYQITPEALADLRRLLAMSRDGTRVVVVEMPVPDSTLSLLGDGEADYQLFMDTLLAETAANKIPFLQTMNQGIVPENGWYNYTHMNQAGAIAFSEWLGKKLVK